VIRLCRKKRRIQTDSTVLQAVKTGMEGKQRRLCFALLHTMEKTEVALLHCGDKGIYRVFFFERGIYRVKCANTHI
jgi:hypothetical protein